MRKLIDSDYHRNGVCGAGFFIFTFTGDENEPHEKGRTFLGITFPMQDAEGEDNGSTEQTAVIDLAVAARGNIRMHSNSDFDFDLPESIAGGNAWRGADYFGDMVVKAKERVRAGWR